MALELTAYISLPENMRDGGFDHAAVHPVKNRLYVAHTANDCIDIINCSSDSYLSSIADLKGVAGALVCEESELAFTSNRGEDTVGIFIPTDEQHVIKVPVGMHPNGLAFDPGRGILLAANVGDPAIPGSYTLSLVDIKRKEMIHSIPVAGRTRWTVFDVKRDEFYVNIMDPALIMTVSGANPDKIVRTMEIPAKGPHGLDMDGSTGRLFCACDDGTLISLEAATGKVLGKAELSGKPDVVFFNPVKKHLYVAVGDPGVIDVFNTDMLKKLESVLTEKGAHTLGFDPLRHKIYAFLPETHRAKVFADYA
jgi:DNA-binding beta-propeller fold protein YncE